jgi:hypothetical protein
VTSRRLAMDGVEELGYWKKHPKKELEAVLREFDSRGWRIENPPTYYAVKCPCPKQHMRYVHLTPSNPRYANEVLNWLRRCECSREEPTND